MVFKEEIEELNKRMQRVGKERTPKAFSKQEVTDIFVDLTKPPKK